MTTEPNIFKGIVIQFAESTGDKLQFIGTNFRNTAVIQRNDLIILSKSNSGDISKVHYGNNTWEVEE